MAAKIFRINYKSDFILTMNSDAGWAIPFCIKFYTSVPSRAYFAGFDGTTYTHCSYDPSEPTKLVVQFDDHHLPIGDLNYQIAYHFTVADFPNDTEDEVINPAAVTTEIDGETYLVMLDFTGETAPEIEFSLPAYANEAARIQNELQRQQNEADRIAAELQREQATAAAVQGAENVNAQLNGTTLTVTNRQGVSTSVNTKGEQGAQGPVGPEGPQGEQGVSIVSFLPKSETSTTLIYTITYSNGYTQDVAIPKGPKGDTGATGPTGPQGPQGVSVIGFTQTGETATNTMYNLVFSDGRTQSVAIPKGTKGDKGDTGNTGAQGAQGPKGDTVTATDYTLYNVQGSDSQGAMSQDATTKAISAQTGYYTCGTISGTAEKVVTVESGNVYKRTLGGHFKVKMTNANTAASGVTLQIGSETAAALLYNGEAVSASNSWEANEVISVYYDGSVYQASNAQGGGGKAEKIKYDNSQSGLAAENVQGALDEVGENVENLNFNVFQKDNITGGIITGSRVNLNGEITSSASSQRTDYIDLTGVDKVYVTTCIVKLASGNDETITLYDSSKNPIRIIKPADFGLANGEYKVLTDYPINVNDDEKYIIVSGRYNIEGAVGLNVTHLTEKESDVTETLDIKWQQTSLGKDYLPSANLNKTRNAALINVLGFNRITLDGSVDEIYVNCYLFDSSYNLIASYDNPWALSRDISIGNAVYMSMACKKGSAGTATLNVGDNTLVVTGYKSAKEKITELGGYIQQLGSECENIEETTEELTGAIGAWNDSTGSIGTSAAIRAHLRINACNVNRMKIVIPNSYYASFFYVDADNISQGQVGTDMGTGTQELELSGEYDLMAIIKYQAAGTTTITATMLAAAPYHVTTYGMNGYDPAAPYSELVEIKEQAFARTANIIDLDSLDMQMLTYNGSGYGSSAIRVAGVLSNNFGKNAVINAAFTSGKMMFHFWHATEEGATIYSLNTTTDTYLGETGWTGTGEVTQVPEECNVIVCLFDATSVSQARSIITSAIITSDVPISNRVSDLEKDVKAISNNAVYNIFKKYRNLTIPQDAQTEIVVMENGDKITHDATHIVKDGKAYVIYCANPHDTGDSGEFSNYAIVRLDIYDVSNGIANATLQSRQIIGGNGYAVGGSTINGGAGVPNAYLVGNIIHIIFGAKIESTWTEIHCTYDTSTSTLGSLEQCTMDSSPLTGAILSTHSSLASSFNNQLSFNASIAEIVVGGTTYYYACICSAARIAKGLIVRTTDFKDWEFVTEPSFTGSGAQYEGAMGVYDGYLYLALRQNVSGTVPNGMLLAKLETDGSVVEYKYLTACNSRPAFYNQDSNLYLIVPSDKRSTATFYRVNGSVNNLTEIAEITGDTNTFGQYLEVVPTSPQYVTYTTDKGYSYSYVRLFASDVIAVDEDVLEVMISKLN